MPGAGVWCRTTSAVQEDAPTSLATRNEQVEHVAIHEASSGNQLPFSTGWQGSERIYGPGVQLRSNDEQGSSEANRPRMTKSRTALVLRWVLPAPHVAF